MAISCATNDEAPLSACNTAGLLTEQRMELAVADAEPNTVVLTFKYKLKPTRQQHEALARLLADQRTLYNAALQERIEAYCKAGNSLSYVDQCASLTVIRRECKGWSDSTVTLHRGTLKRLDLAFRAFFRRLKAGEKPGFPRFKSADRFRSLAFTEWKGITLRDGRIRFKGLPGSLRIHLHRPLPEVKPLACSFTRSAKGWTVCLQYQVPVQSLPATGRQVGIDVGLTTLAMLSTGEAIPNPRHTKRAERELRRRQRALGRCKRGSNRRKRVKARVARLHAQVADARRTGLHQISARLVREHDLISVEKLNNRGLAAGMLAKGVHDAGWATLKEMLRYKAERAGRQLVEVKAAGTSQTCPDCGQIRAKALAERVHRCDCGCVMDRDHAAAIVVLQRAVVRPGFDNPSGAAA